MRSSSTLTSTDALTSPTIWILAVPATVGKRTANGIKPKRGKYSISYCPGGSVAFDLIRCPQEPAERLGAHQRCRSSVLRITWTVPRRRRVQRLLCDSQRSVGRTLPHTCTRAREERRS